MKSFFRVAVAALMIAGVAGIGELDASSVRRGGTCVRVGATTVVRGTPLRCARNIRGAKVWRVNRTTTAATNQTAAIVPEVSLSSTRLVDDTVHRAVTVTANMVGTVYLVEGISVVQTVADITSLSRNRWVSGLITAANTPTSIAIDAENLLNGYYRVFLANNQGALSTPAVNVVTISITRQVETTTTVALTCATGGTCVVGDTGPGGGIVFYVASGTFTQTGASGSMCTTTCKYLEAAPTNWLAGTTGDPTRSWATNVNSNQTTKVTGTDAEAIGSGYQNSVVIVAQTGNVADSAAAVLAREYAGGGKTDWFLPSKDELNELCKYARNTGQTPGDNAKCDGGSSATAIARGFGTTDYWSSSSSFPGNRSLEAHSAIAQYFDNGYQGSSSKDLLNHVRPVRAF
jgi:hypothetical protein